MLLMSAKGSVRRPEKEQGGRETHGRSSWRLFRRADTTQQINGEKERQEEEEMCKGSERLDHDCAQYCCCGDDRYSINC